MSGKKKYIWMGGAIIGIVIALLVGSSFLQKKAVASVEGEKINQDEFYSALKEQYGKDVLENLITNKIIELEVEKEKIKVSDKEVEKEMQALIDSYGGKDAFNQALQTNGVKKSSIKDDVKRFIETKKLLEPRIKITDEEMKTYFEENKETFAEKAKIRASHILVADEKTAKEVATKLADGGDFAELAKEYSTDTASAQSGGDLGYFGKGDMVGEFETAAFALDIGEISDLVKSENGYYIIKVTDRKEAKEANFEDSKEKIKEALFDQKMQSEYTAWLKEKTEEYKIKRNL